MNIPALLLALLVAVSTNGVAFYEHICNRSNSREYSVFSESCKMEQAAHSCCAKPAVKKKRCCEHKQFFSKLNYDGFTAKQLKVKAAEDIHQKYFGGHAPLLGNTVVLENYYCGLPPPDNLHWIAYQLHPSAILLQVFRC
jgi:hypothetical protein